MNQQRIERLIASAVARQINGLVSKDRQEEILMLDDKVHKAQTHLRTCLDDTIKEILHRY